MNSSQTHLQTKELCPHLGLHYDRRTAMDYPSPQNFCHNVTPPATPGIDHQAQYCLTTACSTCRLFTGNSNKRMPVEIQLNEGSAHQKKTRKSPWISLVIFLILLCALAGWRIFFPDLLLKTVSNPPVVLETATIMIVADTQPSNPLIAATATSTITRVLSATPTSTPTMTFTPTTTHTITLTPSYTPVLFQAHLLEVPFGQGQKYLLHQVVDPETIELLAEKYKTTIEVIQKANHNLVIPLNVGTVLIIPLNQTDVSSILPMSAFRMSSSGVTLQMFAQENGFNLDTLIQLNDLAPEYQFQPGEWVIAP